MKFAEQVQSRMHIAELKERVYLRGCCSLKNAFTSAWTEQLRAEHTILFAEALACENGVVSRGQNRFYHSVFPERLSGFLDLLTHPFFTGMCEAVLGKNYFIVETGFNVALQGATDQLWHRDFPIGTETSVAQWLSSLQFNLSTVDVTGAMGAFEYVPGTQWDDGSGFEAGLFPRQDQFSYYQQCAVRTYPKSGDMSCHTGLLIHRGTEHKSLIPGTVLCIKVVADTILHNNRSNLRMSAQFFNSLPAEIQQRLKVELIDGGLLDRKPIFI